MELPGYGGWSAENFKAIFWHWRPDYGGDVGELELFADNLRYVHRYRLFREAFKKMLLDDSCSLRQKAQYYFDGFDTDDTPWEYFKRLWDILFPGAPFPIPHDPEMGPRKEY